MTDLIWLCLPETGGSFACHPDAVDAWTARGWEPCDPPAEPSTLRDPLPVAASADEEATATPAAETKTPKPRRVTSDTNTEE